MTLAVAYDLYQFPIVSQSSSYTLRADQRNDPRRILTPAGHDFSVLALNPVKRKLNEMRAWQGNWDGFGSIKPNPSSISHADALLTNLYEQAVSTGMDWMSPHLSANESGEIVFEWWSGDRKIILYIGGDSAEYVRVWGTHIETEMDDGILEQQTFTNLWQWLNS